MTTNEAADMILWNANFARNPIRATARAASKVGYLARIKGSRALRRLEAALVEHKHGLVRHGLGDMAEKRGDMAQAKSHAASASRHYHLRDVALSEFRAALKG